MHTLPTFWSYSEHPNKYSILLSLYIHKIYLPYYIVNFSGTRTMVLWGVFLIFAAWFFKKLTSTKCLLNLKCLCFFLSFCFPF